jgi:predicted RNase H-like HicB family nuclease
MATSVFKRRTASRQAVSRKVEGIEPRKCRVKKDDTLCMVEVNMGITANGKAMLTSPGNDIEKYTYRIEWSEDDHSHVAGCLEFPSLAAHGDTIEEALREIEYVVAESVKWMQDEGETVPKPLGLKKFKGHITLRIPPEP